MVEQQMYFDPQQEKGQAFCPVCGGAVYPPGYSCIRCGREEP